jgi:hypothetical protein
LSCRTVQAGDVIKLRALIKDDTDTEVEATNVYVHIYVPDVDTDDISLATTVSGVPTYLGQGVFEYQYTVPTAGIAGSWADSWEATLPSQDITAKLAFTVVTSGTINQIGCQLFNNNEVTITIPSGIQALSGDTFLDEELEFSFMTTTSPTYTNIRKVRLEVGGFLEGISDITLQTNILEASLEADVLTFALNSFNSPLYQHARRQYTTCMASQITLGNLNNYLLKSKTLGDLSVTYDVNGIRDAMADLRDCLAKWEPQLLAGGGAKAAGSPRLVVKGELDSDKPVNSRMWEAPTSARPLPAANDRERHVGQRRHVRTFRKKRFW